MSPTRRVLDQDFGARPEKPELVPTLEEPSKNAGRLSRSAVLKAALQGSVLERRETRGCHNRSDYPDLDEGLNVNMVWSGPGRIEREAIPGIPVDIADRMREVSTHGKLVE